MLANEKVIERIRAYGDSLLVINAKRGVNQILNTSLKPFAYQINELSDLFQNILYTRILW